MEELIWSIRKQRIMLCILDSVLLGCVFLFRRFGWFLPQKSAITMQLPEASLLENHLENIQATMKTLRQWKHDYDYHHHTQAMQMLLKNQQYSDQRGILLYMQYSLVNPYCKIQRYYSRTNYFFTRQTFHTTYRLMYIKACFISK